MFFLYIDPGFGSMIIQVIIGIVAAGGAVLYTVRERFVKLFGKSSKEKIVEETEKLEEFNQK